MPIAAVRAGAEEFVAVLLSPIETSGLGKVAFAGNRLQ
jgi:hypothetical protein